MRPRLRLYYGSPSAAQPPLKELFDYAFRLLTDLGIRDGQYTKVLKETLRVCPFCGCEYFDDPTGPREDLDHYLAKSIYPLAAANLENLVPMGGKCNSRYKLDQDILRDRNGNRRRSFYPYSSTGVAVSLAKSNFFGNETGESQPQWCMEFVPDCEEVTTWDVVFDIRQRYKRNVFDRGYTKWLYSFRDECRHKGKNADAAKDDIVDLLGEHLGSLRRMRLEFPERFRIPFFGMLLYQCCNGNERLKEYLWDLLMLD